jgi:hypothetical protein
MFATEFLRGDIVVLNVGRFQTNDIVFTQRRGSTMLLTRYVVAFFSTFI